MPIKQIETLTSLQETCLSDGPALRSDSQLSSCFTEMSDFAANIQQFGAKARAAALPFSNGQ